jgi:DNA-binding SARP family transcriptional activator
VAAFEVVLSRLDYYRNRTESALERARWSVESAGGDEAAGALLNLTSLQFLSGDIVASMKHAEILRSQPASEPVHELALALQVLYAAFSDGDVEACNQTMRRLMRDQVERGENHYAGISALNLAVGLVAQARGDEASTVADEARALLEGDGPRPEAASARAIRAFALALSGNFAAAEQELGEALAVDHDLTRTEVQIEGARLNLWFGSVERAEILLRAAQAGSRASRLLEADWQVTAAELALARGDLKGSAALLARTARGPFGSHAQGSRIRALKARLALQADSPDAAMLAREALDHARRQHAHLWVAYCEVLLALAERNAGLGTSSAGVRPLAPSLDMLADQIAGRLGHLGSGDTEMIMEASARMPGRWLPLLRTQVEGEDRDAALAAARLLNQVGEQQDVIRLRRFVARLKVGRTDKELGRELARRLANRVMLSDLGRTSIQVGDVVIAGSSVRRKVLALLLFLVSRPGFAATRDQVLDALWPDQSPEEAVNSLNQTAYFLRRTFEADYAEATSPGYLNYASDLLWLDPRLVTSRAARCRQLVDQAASSLDPDIVDALCDLYTGPFALEFSYEEWSATFRDSLHAGYLETIERAVLEEINAGRYSRASALARRALDVEPTSEPLQRLLVRVTHRVGAFAAAAERYEIYAEMVRSELGVEPPSIERL